MAAGNDRLLWKRPEDCTCGATLRGEGTGTGSGDFRLVRNVDLACPLHGDRSDVLEDAIAAAEAILQSVPGSPAVTRAQLRRLILAALPVLAKAIAEGRLPNLPVPPVAPPATDPGLPVEPGA